MSEQQTSYRQIMKATSLFGGVQVFQILIQIIRSKVVAVLLGPAGMGIVGLLTLTLSLIGGLTNFGLGTSAVKNIAEANGTGNEGRIMTIVTVLRRLVWITGLLGVVLTIILSPWLSQLTFGNKEYTFSFIWISFTLLFNQLSSGQFVLLQGMRKLKSLAKANLWGSFIGLLITVPLYYKWGVKGIVPVIVITALSTLLLSWYFSSKIKIQKQKVGNIRTYAEGKNMLVMGFMISLNGLITTGAAYLIRIFISRQGGIADVGLYTAGFTIIETYVGLVFTAMATDYFPRLSEVNNDNKKIIEVVNQQASIALLLIMPIIVIFLIFSPLLIQLLYSTKFFAINNMVSFAIVGILFRSVSWSIGFILFAKAESKLLIKTAIGFNSIFLLSNLIGYKLGGLTGIGLSFIVNYLIHSVGMFLISKHRYQFEFLNEIIRIFIFCLLIILVGLFVSFTFSALPKYMLGSLLIFVALYYSFLQLDKRLNLMELFHKFTNKNNK